MYLTVLQDMFEFLLNVGFAFKDIGIWLLTGTFTIQGIGTYSVLSLLTVGFFTTLVVIRLIGYLT